MSKLTAHKAFTFTGHKDCIYGLGQGFAPGTFFTGGAEGWIVEWDAASKGDGNLLVQVGVPVYSFLLLRDQKQLLCGTRAGNLHLVDLEHKKEIRNIEAHGAGIFDIQQHGHYILTAGGEGTVKVWDKTTLLLVHEIKASDKSARVIAIEPEKPQIAVGYSDNAIRIFNTGGFELAQEIQAHDNSVFALAYSQNGRYLLSGGRDAVLKVWDAENEYAPVQTINAHWYHINAIQYNPEGTLFATASMDKTVKIWDAATFELLKVLDKEKNEGHTSSVNKILWIDNKHLISCGDDRAAILWQIETKD